jgi:hypothetical protein
VIAVLVKTPYGVYPLQEYVFASNKTGNVFSFFGNYYGVQGLQVIVANGSSVGRIVLTPANDTFPLTYTGLVLKGVRFSESIKTYPAANFTFALGPSVPVKPFQHVLNVVLRKSLGFYPIHNLPSYVFNNKSYVDLLTTFTLVTPQNSVLKFSGPATFSLNAGGYSGYYKGSPAIYYFAYSLTNQTSTYLPGYGDFFSLVLVGNETVYSLSNVTKYQLTATYEGLPIAYNLTGAVGSVVPSKVILLASGLFVAKVGNYTLLFNASGVYPVQTVTSAKVVNLTVGQVSFLAQVVNVTQGVSLVQLRALANGSVVLLNSNLMTVQNALIQEASGNVTALVFGKGVYYLVYTSTGKSLVTTTTQTTATTTSQTTTTSTTVSSSTSVYPSQTTSSTTSLATSTSTSSSQPPSSSAITLTSSSTSAQSPSVQQLAIVGIAIIVVMIAVGVALLLRRK